MTGKWIAPFLLLPKNRLMRSYEHEMEQLMHLCCMEIPNVVEVAIGNFCCCEMRNMIFTNLPYNINYERENGKIINDKHND